MNEVGIPTLGGALNASLRGDLAELIRSLPMDEGGGASLLKVLLLGELIVSQELTRVVEIGVYHGRLMLPLARLMARLGRGEVIGIDPYSAEAAVQRDVNHLDIDLVEWPNTVDWEGLYQEVAAAISRWNLAGHARLIRKPAVEAAASFQQSSIDLLHIDGNHDSTAVKEDVELYLPYLRDGGFLVMDDIAWTSVRPVYERLVQEHELLFDLVEHGISLFPDDNPNEFGVLRIHKGGTGNRPSG